MPEPAQLFSTLVQAAATVIALTLGFASTLYDSRIDNLQETTNDLRSEFVDLRDKYQSVASSMALKLREQGDFDDPRHEDLDPQEWMDQYGAEQTTAMLLHKSQRIDMSVEEINEWAEGEPDTQAARAWGLLLNVSGILNNITELNSNILDIKQFHELRDSASTLDDLFDARSDENKELYQDLTDNEPDSGYPTESIVEESETLVNWLDNHIDEIDERMEGWSSLKPHADGTNLVSFAMVTEELKINVFETVGKILGSALMPSSDPVATLNRILCYAVGLGIFGVFLPLLFLITPSNVVQIQLPLWFFQIVQVILIGGSILFAYLLFNELYDFIRQRAGDV